MSDTKRTSLVIAAALAASAASLGELIAASETQAIPVNIHTATGLLSSFATDAAEFAADVAAQAPADVSALTDRVAQLETLLVEAGIKPNAAPAPAPAVSPAAVAPAPVVDGASNPPL